MGHRKKRKPGPQQHAEGQHGDQTHKAFIEQLQHPRRTTAWAVSEEKPRDDDVLSHARIPHEGDST